MMRKIVIVGGGSAGWFTAAHLSKFFNDKITLIETPSIQKIGVGESVTPHVSHFFNQLGIEEKHWMLHTGSIYKYANKFVNWYDGKDPEYFGFHYTTSLTHKLPTKPEDYIYNKSSKRNTDFLLGSLNRNQVNKFDRHFHWHYHYMENNVAPFKGKKYIFKDQPYSYSQHINAERAAEYCRDFIALPNGVEHIEAKVTKVNVDSNGISSLLLEDGSQVQGDLYIDCSGFKRLLMSAVDAKTKRYENYPIDSAWVCQIDYDDIETQLVNHTQTIAHDYGWQFKIGLYHRMGTGYCYSSSHSSDAQAEEYFDQLIPNKRKTPRLIKWTPERLQTPGLKNVAAVGLSNGFIEPLEANALYIIIASIHHLSAALQEPVINLDAYNKAVNYFMDDIADFLIVHYTLSNKTSSVFWKDCIDIGVKQSHNELVYSKYNDERNYMSAAFDGLRTLFPDYMWAQFAHSWNMDISEYDYVSSDYEKLILDLDTHHLKRSAISENYYQWLKNKIFENLNPRDWEEKFII